VATPTTGPKPGPSATKTVKPRHPGGSGHLKGPGGRKHAKAPKTPGHKHSTKAPGVPKLPGGSGTPPKGPLPFTGLNTDALLLIALGALTLGGLMLGAAKRPRLPGRHSL
jgi:hypothetical protein